MCALLQAEQAAVGDSLVEAPYRLPVHHGELYLELHQGTLTTQAAGKAGNMYVPQSG